MLAIMSLCIVWRGAMALIIASMSRGSTVFFSFHLELGLIRRVTASKAGYAPLARAGGVFSGCAGKSLNGTDGFGRGILR